MPFWQNRDLKYKKKDIVFVFDSLNIEREGWSLKWRKFKGCDQQKQQFLY